MSDAKYPSIELVRQCFRYDDGRLLWLPRPLNHFKDERAWKTWNAIFPGSESGRVRVIRKDPMNPRWIIRFGKREHLRYTLIWAIHHGEWAIGIDHKNRNSIDDRIGNLRIADKSQNGANARLSRRNRSGYKGVSWDKTRNLWIARIQASGGLNRQLGRFSDPHEAHLAYMDAAEKMSGEFASDGITLSERS